jgi:hypothetical protein
VAVLYWSDAMRRSAHGAAPDRMAMACCSWGCASTGFYSSSIVVRFTRLPLG